MHLVIFNTWGFSELAFLAVLAENIWTQSEMLIDFQPSEEDSSLPIMGFKQRRKWVEVERLAFPAYPLLLASHCCPSADKWCSACPKHRDRMLYGLCQLARQEQCDWTEQYTMRKKVELE